MAIFYGRVDSERRLLSKYPKEVKKLNDIPKVYDELKKKLKENDSGFFAFIRRWNKKRQITKFKKNRNDPLHAGAKGENRVKEQLSALDDSYHVLCGVRIWLPYTVRYNGQKNLRSAQMDFVVVSKKGAFVIEVKNWRDGFVKNRNGFSPHEQAERAGRVLWIALNQAMLNVRVTNVLLSIKDNIQYDQNYRMVFVTSLERINDFLRNRQDILSENEVKKIVSNLKRHATY